MFKTTLILIYLPLKGRRTMIDMQHLIIRIGITRNCKYLNLQYLLEEL